MTAARTSHERRQLAAELSFRMTMAGARASLAQDRARQQEAAEAARFAALQPLLAAAGYGEHNGGDRLRAEARAVRARAVSRSAGGTEPAGPDCEICAQEKARRAYAARRGEITR